MIDNSVDCITSDSQGTIAIEPMSRKPMRTSRMAGIAYIWQRMPTFKLAAACKKIISDRRLVCAASYKRSVGKRAMGDCDKPEERNLTQLIFVKIKIEIED